MAYNPQVGSEGHAWSGLFASGKIPERYKEMDNLGKLAFITRHSTPFLSKLTQKFPKAKTKSKREFSVHEIDELLRTFQVSVASTDTNHQAFGLTNAEAQEITENDVLYLRNVYASVEYDNLVTGQVIAGGGTNVGPDILRPVGGNPTNIKFNRGFGAVAGTYFTSPEAVKVVEVGAENSAGTGHTLVKVRRCMFGPGGTDAGGKLVSETLVNSSIVAQDTVANFQEGDVLLRGLPVFKEGTGSPTGVWKNPIIDSNFTQEFKYAVETTKESEIDTKGIQYSPKDLQRMLVNRRMMLDIERTMIFGRKGVTSDGQGKATYLTGGVVEFIPKDEKHIIAYEAPTINYSDLLDVGYKIFDNGGSAQRDCYIGVKLYNKFKKAFAEHESFRFNMEETKHFDIPIETIYVSGGQLNLIPLHCMDELGWADKMICLDMGYPSFVPVTHDGWDMKVNKDIGPRDVQMYKEEVIGMKGLERRYAQYQCIVDFSGFTVTP